MNDTVEVINGLELKNPTDAVKASVKILAERVEYINGHAIEYITVSHRDAQSTIYVPGNVYSHGITRTVWEHAMIQNTERQEALRQEREKKKANYEAAKKRCDELYGEHSDLVWKKKISWALEEEVAAEAKALLKNRKAWAALVTPGDISRYRKQHCPHLTGPRFDSALAIADAIFQKR